MAALQITPLFDLRHEDDPRSRNGPFACQRGVIHDTVATDPYRGPLAVLTEAPRAECAPAPNERDAVVVHQVCWRAWCAATTQIVGRSTDDGALKRKSPSHEA